MQAQLELKAAEEKLASKVGQNNANPAATRYETGIARLAGKRKPTSRMPRKDIMQARIKPPLSASISL